MAYIMRQMDGAIMAVQIQALFAKRFMAESVTFWCALFLLSILLSELQITGLMAVGSL